MSDSKDFRPTSETEMEVELSAQDLIDLTPPQPAVATATVPGTSPAVTTVAAAKPANSPEFATKSPKGRLSPRTLRVAAVAAVSVIAAVSVAELAPPQQRIERPVSDWSPVPDPVMVDEPELPPTRYANPFDPSEVFELPPGLSPDEARAMVEGLLLQRASERGIYGRAG